MKICFKPLFFRQIKKITDKSLKEHVEEAIKSVEKAGEKKDIPCLKKLKGYKIFYRIKVDNYRIGVTIESDTVTFVIFMPRKDIYKFFP